VIGGGSAAWVSASAISGDAAICLLFGDFAGSCAAILYMAQGWAAEAEIDKGPEALKLIDAVIDELLAEPIAIPTTPCIMSNSLF
jgi:hypothetical protein